VEEYKQVYAEERRASTFHEWTKNGLA